tara:strand:- start:132 stop:719 length:588 start_codon:yes stop_codon:yes gene_type:complete
MKKKYFVILLIFFFILIFVFLNLDFLKKKNSETKNIKLPAEEEIPEESVSSSNIMNNVTYSSLDLKGNEYIINAEQAEIDISNRDILYLTNVTAIIKLNNSEEIEIFSDYGKYNSLNNDTIFSKNVIINYLYNKITSEYLDFSISRNTMIISKNVIYTNLENILRADVMEMDIKTKDTKIYMHENKKKVNIKNKE